MENLKLQINDLSVAYTPEKLAVKHEIGRAHV